jgi:ABC-type transporter Mla subunit MlaD
MKTPEVALGKILGGLQKVLAQLEAHKEATDQYVADKEIQIAQLQNEQAVAKQAAARSSKVAENLKDLLVVK